MAELSETQGDNSFVLLGRELRQRLATPLNQFSFWVFVLIGVILSGGIAIWVEVAKFIPGIGAVPHVETLRTALDTYFPAIGCAAAVQLAFAAEHKKYLVSFGYLVTVFFAVSSVLMLLLEKTPATFISWSSDAIGCLLAILMWCIANGLDVTYQDTAPNPDAPVGGPVQTLTSLPGDTSGFAT